MTNEIKLKTLEDLPLHDRTRKLKQGKKEITICGWCGWRSDKTVGYDFRKFSNLTEEDLQ